MQSAQYWHQAYRLPPRLASFTECWLLKYHPSVLNGWCHLRSKCLNRISLGFLHLNVIPLWFTKQPLPVILDSLSKECAVEKCGTRATEHQREAPSVHAGNRRPRMCIREVDFRCSTRRVCHPQNSKSLENDRSQVKSGLQSAWGNKVLLEHGHVHSLITVCGCLCSTEAELNSSSRDRMVHEAPYMYLSLHKRSLLTLLWVF